MGAYYVYNNQRKKIYMWTVVLTYLLGPIAGPLLQKYMNENTSSSAICIGTLCAVNWMEAYYVPLVIDRISTVVTNGSRANAGPLEVVLLRNLFLRLVLVMVLIQWTYMVYEEQKITFAPRLKQFLMDELMHLTMRAYERDHSSVDTAMVFSKLYGLHFSLKRLLNAVTTNIIPYSVSLISLLASFARFDLRLSGLIAAVLVLYGWILLKTAPIRGDVARLDAEQVDAYTRTCSDRLRNMTSIIAVTGRDSIAHELEELGKLSEQSFSTAQTAMTVESAHKNIMRVLNLVLVMILMSYAYATAVRGGLTHVPALMALSQVLFWTIYSLSAVLTDAMISMEYIRHHGQFLAADCLFSHETQGGLGPFSVSCQKPSDVPVLDPAAGVEFDDVTFAFRGSQRPLFRHLSLTIPRGKIVALTGRSGSGKTTFVRLLRRFLTPQSGSIRLCSPARNVAYVAQNTSVLFDRTIEENILYGHDFSEPGRIRRRRRLREIVRETHLWEVFGEKEQENTWRPHTKKGREKTLRNHGSLIDPLSSRFDRGPHMFRFLRRKVGPLGERLSGGQRQIVYILRCLVNDSSDIVILDEPTSALDAATRLIVLRLIRGLDDGQRTVIVVTHDADLERACTEHLKFPL